MAHLDMTVNLHRKINVKSLWPVWCKDAGHYDDHHNKIEDIIEGPPQMSDDEVDDLLTQHGYEPVNPIEAPEDFEDSP